MKQLIVKKTIYFIVLNLIFSGLITFAVSYFTVDRHGKVLILGLNNQTKEFDYLESGPSTSYEDPKVFFRRIDMELRSEKSIFETSNRCLNLGKLKGTLPISINHYEKTFEIQIISEDEKAVLDCTIYIIELTELYNKKIQNRFKENFLFQYQENIFYDPRGN